MMESVTQELGVKYNLSIPGLEQHRMGSRKEVMQTIKENAQREMLEINEDDIDKLYTSHKTKADADLNIKAIVKLINYLIWKDPGDDLPTRLRNRIFNYGIRKDYYAYLYIDFPSLKISLAEISLALAYRLELLEICPKVLAEYNEKDFKNVELPSDPMKEGSERELNRIKKELQLIDSDPNASMRKKYNARKSYERQLRIVKGNLSQPNYKPVHHMKIALSSYNGVYYMSKSGLEDIIIYHIRSQVKEKKHHNKHYKSFASAERKNMPSKNVENIAGWINNNPEKLNKSKCARELNIHRSTVLNNWEKALPYVLKISKKTEI